MINFDSLCLKFFEAEYKPLLEEARIQKIQQPSRKELILSIRAQAQTLNFYININPKYPHLCMLTKRGEGLRNIQKPLKPPMFCMLLRKYMQGAKIKAVKVPDHERIFEIFIDSCNDLGDVEELVLSVELMGKYSNIILYKNEDKTIIGCAHNIGAEKSRIRELAGGLPYVYPPVQNKKNILDVSQEEFYQDFKLVNQPIFFELNQTYHDISIALSKELCEEAGIFNDFEKISAVEKQKIFKLYELTKNAMSSDKIAPSITKDKSGYSLFDINTTKENTKFDSLNEMINEYFGHFVFEDTFNHEKNSLLSVLNKNIKHLKKEIEHFTSSEQDEKKGEKYKQIADILAANIYTIQEAQSEVELENFYDNNTKIKIKLDTSLSLNENIARYYKLHTKTKTALKFNAQRKELLMQELFYLEEIENAILLSEKFSGLKEIKEEMSAQNLLKPEPQEKSKHKNAKNEPEIDSVEFEGYTIFIGKNHKQNDYIVSKLSRSEDIWMHAQNMPGSHILIKVPPQNPQIPDSVLLKAAQLAAFYSKARESAKTEIIYVPRKQLKKPPGAKPGYVTYSGEKTVIVDKSCPL